MPKRVPPLSAKALAAIKPSAAKIELVDGYVPGLRVRILHDGSRAWSLNIRDRKGVRRRFEVGNGFTLAEARRRAEDLRRAIRDGADPTADRRAARQRARAALEGIGTFGALVEDYFTKGPGSKQRRATKTKQLLKTVFVDALDTPLLDLERTRLQLLADNWKSANTSALAVRCIRPCLKWAARRGLAYSGISDLEQTTPVTKRERFLTANELQAVWSHLQGAHGEVMKWLLWTGCRLNEAAGMTWAEITNDVWKIPASRSKNGRERIIPMPKQAMQALTGFGQQDPECLVFPSKRGGKLSNWDRETKQLQGLSKTSGWHRHDLRRTVATMLGDFRSRATRDPCRTRPPSCS